MARAQEMLDNKAAQELLDGKLPYRPDNIRRSIYPSDRARSVGSFGPGSSSYEYGGQTFDSFDALASHVQ
ncbi:hypothetical protein, partial [Escherichia coli]|uniref:hypothetical protein n=1 Tax=Escherichia coli TaxID=562 RepID=UPI00200C7DFA